MSKIVVLLGAGASMDAGVPDTRGMTAEITNVLETDPQFRRFTFSEVLSFVVGGVTFRAGATGGDPFADVDVEEVLNAITLLADRGEIEALPFISSWHPRVAELEAEAVDAYSELSQLKLELSTLLTETLQHARDSTSSRPPRTEDFVRALEAAIRTIARRGSQGIIFREAADAMFSALTQIVWLEEAQRVAYLKPLFELSSRGRLCIATLNYDNAIELAALSSGLNITDGIEAWSQQGIFAPQNNAPFFLKLHGSIDWYTHEQPQSADRPLARNTPKGGNVNEIRISKLRPAILFGGRQKLTAEGPFLDLLRAFAQELAEADGLIVIGYSFRDPHVNEYISRWINNRPQGRLVIVDPSFNNSPVQFARRLKGCGDRVQIMAISAREAISQLPSMQ